MKEFTKNKVSVFSSRWLDHFDELKIFFLDSNQGSYGNDIGLTSNSDSLIFESYPKPGYLKLDALPLPNHYESDGESIYLWSNKWSSPLTFRGKTISILTKVYLK